MMKYNAYIFDLDGTLLDTLGDLASSCNYALRTNGLPERTLEEVRMFVGNGVRKLMERAVPNGEANPAFDAAYATFRRHYMEHNLDTTCPYPGVMDMLASLRRNGASVAVVSNKFNAANLNNIKVFRNLRNKFTVKSFDFFSTEDEFSIITPPLVGERISDEKDNLILIDSGVKKEYEKKNLQPSSIPPLKDVRVSMEKDFSSRIQVSSNADPALIGTAIHDVFCVLEKNKDIEFISSIIESHGFRKEIPNSDEVLRAWNNLESYLKEQYGEEYTTLHECPFSYEEDSFEVNGSIDLVWETKEGAVLIDYKTFQGKKNSILDPGDSHYAGLYSGQFSAYRKALEKAGRKVLASFVYYPVAGCLFRIEW